ncbi:type II secretion system F family protein [Candidatus Woesearchaeota archaeon]|nr:type II secretion system F family protein [Candidatus Woesearchaeota archaeon]
MKFTSRHIAAILLGIATLVVDFYFFLGTPWFIPLVVVALTIGWSQHWIDFFTNLQMQRELETRFPDLVRNMVGAVNSGMPLSKAIIYVSKLDYGALTPHVKKLANQVEWAIPVHKALVNFSTGTGNPVIKRAVSTVIEAERSGGNVEDVLETVTRSVIEIKKMKQRRKASIHSQMIQSYIIFFVFLAIMIVVQNMVVPYIAETQEAGIPGMEEEEVSPVIVQTEIGKLAKKVEFDFSSLPGFINSLREYLSSLRGVFLSMALIQGLFAGLVIGKLAEGEVYAGIKHSLILMTVAFFVISLAQSIG